MSGQPYSRAAWEAAVDAKATRVKTSLHAAMDAAHDREALGLDASARIGDILGEVEDLLTKRGMRVAAAIVVEWSREFGDEQ